MNVLDRLRINKLKENKNSGNTFKEFDVCCKVCGSKAVAITRETAGGYSEYTQWDASLGFKCTACGMAEKVELYD